MATKRKAPEDKQKPGGKRTALERAAYKEAIAKYDRRGFTLSEIADEMARLGFTRVTAAQLCIDRREMREEYKLTQIEQQELLVKEKLAQYRELLAEAWRGWDRSQLDSEKRVEEFAPAKPDDEDEPEGGGKKVKPKRRNVQAGSIEDSLERFRLIVTREGRLPANEYLRTILMIHQAVRDMLGLDAPKRSEHSGDPLVGVDARQQTVVFNWNGLNSMPDEPDPVEAKLAEAERLALNPSPAEAVPEPSSNGHT